MTDFLLELRSEEIPARMQDKARADLSRLFGEELAKAGLKVETVETYATPRRLALIAKGLPLETTAVSEETKGPKTSAPPQALEGFLRKTGLTQDQLEERDGVYFAVVEKPGRKTADVLAEAIPAIIRAFQWPKSMRWGAASASTESLRWVRPLQGIVALLGDEVVECKLPEISAGSTTTGHRFMHQAPLVSSEVETLVTDPVSRLRSTQTVKIGNASTYAADLRAAYVIVDQDERRAIIRAGAEKAAGAAGLVLVPDEGLVAENAGLTEWPVPMLGRFDPAFLEVPEEVIQLTARVNQKYFICRDSAGKLANAFICTANLEPSDGGATVIAGNEKVLAARLSDAKFFWEQDLKVRLEDQAAKLSQIVFHEKLGTVADKVERVAKLAEWLVTEGIVKGCSAVDARKAAELCKADLVTGMVGEFPELQGVMGGYYARAQGHDDAIADAIRDHYKPVGQGDDVPTAPVTVAVSLADKLDNTLSFFSIDLGPTGSKDPFAIRRAMIGISSILDANQIRIGLNDLVLRWVSIAYDVMRLNFDDSASNNTAIAERNLQLKAIFDFIAKPEFSAVTGDVVRLLEPLIDPGKPPRFGAWIEALNRGRGDTWLSLRSVAIGSLADRLKVQQREAGVRHDLIDAVFALGGEDDLVRLLARVKALQAFVGTDAGANLLAGYKRAGNILKQNPSPLEGEGGPQGRVRGSTDGGSMPPKAISTDALESLSAADAAGPSPALRAPSPSGGEGLEVETNLQSALDTAEPLATAAIAAEDFEGAMSALSTLRAPIDAFFEGVMVNDPDPHKRAYRIGLLERFVSAVHRVADFSKIEG